MSIQIDDAKSSYDATLLQQKLPLYSRALLSEFRRVAQSFVSFNALFALLLAFEVVGTVVSIPFFGRSVFMAVCLSALFLTFFSYLVLSFYYSSQKPEQFFQIREQFLRSCRECVEEEISFAEPLANLADYLQNFEQHFYQASDFLRPFVSRMSASFYRKDVFQMKQLLIQGALQEQLRQVRTTPTDLELHAALAHSYTELAQIYRDFLPFERSSRRKRELQRYFQAATNGAMEEFRILNDYAPNDPWIHEQIASGHRALGQKEREIQELELLRALRPQDVETLFRLGSLYFELNSPSNGLRIYDTLRSLHLKKAEELIAFYGHQTLPFSTIESP